MNTPTPATDADVKAQVSPEEWALRIDLAAAYRLVAHFKWDDLVFTHLSVRIPGPEHHFLINPYGMMFDEITASSLVKVDLNGEKVMDTPYLVNPAGFIIHSAIHSAREDANCVMHTHTLNGVAVAAQKGGLLPISQQSAFVMAGLSYHDYEGVAVRPDEKERLVADLGERNNFMILRNHGLLTCGPTVADAFLAMYLLEASCRIQTLAQAGGGELIPVGDQILGKIQEEAAKASHGMGGALIWPGLLRRLDRIDPSFRD